MMIEGAPQPVAPFSHIVECDGWCFLTGQMPTDPDDPDKPLPQGIDTQAIRGGEHLDLSHVVQARVYLRDFGRDYAAMNETYKSYFKEGRLPARTCVGVTDMAVGALVEIDMVARRPA